LLGWRACQPARLLTWRPAPAEHSGVPLRLPNSLPLSELLNPRKPLAPLASLNPLDPPEPWEPLATLKPLEPPGPPKPLPPFEPLEPPGRESLRSIVERFGLQVPYGLGEGNDTLFKHRFLSLFFMVGQNLFCENS
jgi:hypothetical protein